jgi:alpha-glucoside transport system substrate-binding protein
LSQFMNMDFLHANYKQSWLDMATMPAPGGAITTGVWSRVNGKSLVWYPRAAFEKAGYQVPTTWDALLQLMDQIKRDGGTPWCVGIEADAATGWPATDWIEDILLRTTSLQNYDRWVAGDLKFTSPEVTNAFTYLSEIWFDSGNVYGGRKAIATTSFIDAARPMFENPPRCWLHRQASFITLFFPKDAKMGVDYDFFYLPPIDARFGSPMLVSGDLLAMFKDRPEVRAVMEWFATATSVEGWVKAGGAISPHNDASLEWYPNDMDRKIAEMIHNADSVRFDGSDQMPAVVGAGSFLKQVTAAVTGTIDLPTAQKAIDDSWPKKP